MFELRDRFIRRASGLIFPSTRPPADYGRLEATVEQVGTDALTPVEQKQRLGTNVSGLFYPAVLSLSRQTLQAGSKGIPLQPGMGLTADIHLRQRHDQPVDGILRRQAAQS